MDCGLSLVTLHFLVHNMGFDRDSVIAAFSCLYDGARWSSIAAKMKVGDYDPAKKRYPPLVRGGDGRRSLN